MATRLPQTMNGTTTRQEPGLAPSRTHHRWNHGLARDILSCTVTITDPTEHGQCIQHTNVAIAHESPPSPLPPGRSAHGKYIVLFCHSLWPDIDVAGFSYQWSVGAIPHYRYHHSPGSQIQPFETLPAPLPRTTLGAAQNGTASVSIENTPPTIALFPSLPSRHTNKTSYLHTHWCRRSRWIQQHHLCLHMECEWYRCWDLHKHTGHGVLRWATKCLARDSIWHMDSGSATTSPCIQFPIHPRPSPLFPSLQIRLFFRLDVQLYRFDDADGDADAECAVD